MPTPDLRDVVAKHTRLTGDALASAVEDVRRAARREGLGLPAEQRQAVQLVVDDLAAVWGKQEALAKALGVSAQAVSSWISGERCPGWAVIVGAALTTLRFHPAAAPAIVGSLAGRILGLRGRWVPDDDDLDVGEWSEEAADVAVLHGQLHDAVRRRDQGAVDQIAARAPRELRQALVAARRAVAGGRAA